jgi:hypothetical protein
MWELIEDSSGDDGVGYGTQYHGGGTVDCAVDFLSDWTGDVFGGEAY